MNGYLKPIAAVVCVAAATVAAPAYAEQWRGTWKTTFGDIRLIQEDDFIYGDYRGGTIQGILDRPSRTLRGVVRNPDGTVGLVEWKIDPANDRFAGAWDWQNQNVPRHDAGAADRRWSGTQERTQEANARPSVRNFSQKPNRSSFINSAPEKYRKWIANFARVNPLASKYPKLADYPIDFTPTMVELDFREIGFLAGITPLMQGAVRNAHMYGQYGVYMYCETRDGSRPIAPLYGKANQVFNKPREAAVRISWLQGNTVVDANQGIRRFPLDSQCANDPGARFLVQIQTNLNERNAIPARDSKFGYQSYSFYLDQMPNSATKDFEQETSSSGIFIANYYSIYDVFVRTNSSKHTFKVAGVRGSVRFIR